MLSGNSAILFLAFFSLRWVWSLSQHCSTGAGSTLVIMPASTLPACSYFTAFSILMPWWNCSVGQLRGTPRKVSEHLAGNDTAGDTSAGLNDHTQQEIFHKVPSLPWILGENNTYQLGLQRILWIRNQIPKYFWNLTQIALQNMHH